MNRIGGYELLGPLTTAGGGHGQWGFAKRAGRQYFLKRFLAPTFPTPGSPGSEATKKAKRQRCERFELHHRRMKEALGPVSGPGGNLIVTLDFFRDGTHYYKTTAKVDGQPLSADISAVASSPGRIAVLVAIASCVQILHRMRIVHGDLKPGNILVERNPRPSPKLIDFDNAFLFGEPPTPEEMVGDAVYFSPELLAYVNGGEHADLSGASDVFALGLVFAEYLLGNLPTTDRRRYPAEIVANGGRLEIPVGPALPLRMQSLLRSMLQLAPSARPTVGNVVAELKEVQAGRASPPTPTSGTPKRRLRGTLPLGPTSSRRSGLRGTLRTSDSDGLADCMPVVENLRHAGSPNASIGTLWGLVTSVRDDVPSVYMHEQPSELLALLPDRIRLRLEELRSGIRPNAVAWVKALLDAGSSVELIPRLRPTPRAPSGSVSRCPPARHESSSRVEIPSAPTRPRVVQLSDEEQARVDLAAADAAGGAAGLALAWMRLRALAPALTADETAACDAAIASWGAAQ